MRATAATLFAATLLGCGPSKPAAEPTPTIDRKSACDGGDVAACVEQATAECTDTAWQLDIDQPTPLYVAPSGVARLDRLGVVLLGTNAHQWLACVEDCPGTHATNVCIPFAFDLSFAYTTTGTCERSERDVQAWNGLPSRAVVLDCPDAFAEISYVPGLDAIQHALGAAHLLDTRGPLDLPGLVVDVNVAGEPLFRIHRATDANCAVFAIPQGYKVIRGAEAFATATRMQPDLEASFQAARAELQREVEKAVTAARNQADTEVAALCQQHGYPAGDDGTQRCIFELAEARAIITKAVGEARERYGSAIDPKVDAAMAEHVLTPLCQQFTGN